VGRLVKSLRKRALLVGAVAAAAVTAAVVWQSGSRLAVERDEAVQAMRETARTCVSAALNLRRKGATMTELRPFVQSMKAAYARAKERAPASAEVEYLMGRIRRVVIDHDLALEHQNRALAIDPAFGPALYERVLLASRLRSNAYWAVRDAVRAETGTKYPADWLARAERINPAFARVRGEMIRDLAALERAPGEEIRTAQVSHVRGIVAFWTVDYAGAREHLAEAVREDPTLEEAWELLALTLAQFYHDAVEPTERLARWQEAIDCYDQAIFFDRGFPRLWNLRAALHFEGFELCAVSGRDPLAVFAAAERDSTEVCRLMPGQYSPWYLRSKVRYHRGLFRKGEGADPREDLDEAERCAGEALRCKEVAEAYSLRGAVRIEKAGIAARTAAAELYRSAIADYEKAVALDASLARTLSPPLDEVRRRLGALPP
jgi:tetratricopeptide (TPR) repeat protein